MSSAIIKLTIIIYLEMEGGRLMKKFSLIFTLVIFVSVFLVGCNSSLDDNVVSLKETNLSLIKDNGFFSTTLEKDLLNNIFLIENTSGQYVVFYKTNIDKESISCSVKDSVLEINLETLNNTENTYGYEIIHDLKKSYDTIKLIKDDEEVYFSSVIKVN